MPSDSLAQLWSEHFAGGWEVEASAPGRVNLIGEHTDYNLGYVFPAAISRRTCLLARRVSGPMRIVSAQSGWIDGFLPGEAVSSRGWGRYAAACARAFEDATGEPPPSLEGALASTVPSGSGLSSSAALDVCLLAAWNEIGGYGFTPMDLASLSHDADRKYVGVLSGMMDPMASALGRAHHALFIDTRSLEVRYAALPDGITIAVLDTHRPRSLAASAYNERVAECARAAAAMGVETLRDATPELLAAAEVDETARKRARHVLSENERTLRFREALEAGDRSSLGDLCRKSHESLRFDYEVSCPELDTMARSAWNAPGCVAARMTGAGFGGCCVALVESAAFADFERAVRSSYGMYQFKEPSIYAVEAAEGARAARSVRPGT